MKRKFPYFLCPMPSLFYFFFYLPIGNGKQLKLGNDTFSVTIFVFMAILLILGLAGLFMKLYGKSDKILTLSEILCFVSLVCAMPVVLISLWVYIQSPCNIPPGKF